MISKTRKSVSEATPNATTIAAIKEVTEDKGAASEKLGPELLAEAAEEVTLDRYLDRNPKIGQPINYHEMVTVLQKKRAAFITAEQKRKSGIKEGEDE